MKRKLLTILILIFCILTLTACFGKKDPSEHKHIEVEIPEIKATCTESGLTAGKKCSECGEIIVAQKEIEAKGHTPEIIRGFGATCTSKGKTDGKKCSDCGLIYVEQEDILVIEHILIELPEKKATCNETGLSAGEVCKMCGVVFSGRHEISRLNHIIDEPVFVWYGYEAIAKFNCENDCGYSDDIIATVTSDIILAPTDSECGMKSYTASVTRDGKIYTDDRKEILPPSGHTFVFSSWKWTQNKAEIMFVCTNESNHRISIDAYISGEYIKEPTCTDQGIFKYTASVTFNGSTYESFKIEIAPANGHTEVVSVGKSPTCTEDGYTEGTYCSECQIQFSGKESIPAIGHLWGEPIFIWNEFEATAEFICQNDASHKEALTATVTNEITKEATAEELGVRTYTASVYFNDVCYISTKEEIIPAKGHKFVFARWEWSSDYTAEAVFICTTEAEHEIKITATVSSVITKKPECTQDGIITYNATVVFEDKTYTDSVEATVFSTEHTYTKEVVSENTLRLPATCLQKATYYCTCENCGDISSELYFEHGTEADHIFARSYPCSESVCIVCGYVQNADAEHTYTEWLDVEKSACTPEPYKMRICIYCGHIECSIDTSVKYHHDYIILKLVNPTCTEKGYVVFVCSRCSDEQTVELDSLGAHNYIWVSTATEHYRECINENCDSIVDIGPHKGIILNCEIGENCEQCGYLMSGPKNHSFKTVETKEPNCVESGHSSYKQCENCYIREDYELIPPLGHKFDDVCNWKWTSNYEYAHGEFTCTVCGHVHVVDAYVTKTTDNQNPCTESGVMKYTARLYFNGKSYVDNKFIDTIPSGHKYNHPIWSWANGYSSATAKFICKFCLNSESVTDSTIEIKHISATCESSGVTIYKASVEFKGNTYTDEKRTGFSLLQHPYVLDSWIWTNGEKVTAKAKFVCTKDPSHTYTVTANVTEIILKEPTCMSIGKARYTASATLYDKTYTDTKEYELPISDCEYLEPTWVWSSDYSSAVANFVCKHNSAHKISRIASITITDKPGCISEGTRYYTATVILNGKYYRDQKTEKTTPVGHNWSSGYRHTEYTHYRICNNCGTARDAESHDLKYEVLTKIVEEEYKTYYRHTVKEWCTVCNYYNYSESTTLIQCEKIVVLEAVQPTCTKPGLTMGWWCDECNIVYQAQEVIPATGIHIRVIVPGEAPTCGKDGKTAGEKCATCDLVFKEQERIPATGDHVIVTDYTTPPTCTMPGYSDRTYCKVCGKVFDESELIPALGHDWGAPIFVWNGYSSAVAKFYCGNDASHVKTVNATITSRIINADCIGSGSKIYTATVVFGGITYTDTKTETIDAIGHNWGAPTFTWSGYTSASAKFVCSNNSTHTETVTATITSSITTNPTCTGTGIRTYTATVTFDGRTYTDTKTETISSLGHNYVNRECTRCGDSLAPTECYHEYDETTLVFKKDATCLNDGYSLYTCKHCGEAYIPNDKWINSSDEYHNYNIVEEPATCTATGVIKDVCEYCKDEKNIVETPVLGHSLGAWYTVNSTTERRDCERENCDYYETKTSEHIHSYTPTVTAPTCTEQGYTTYTCFCGYSYVGDYVDAVGHIWNTPTWRWSGYTSASAKFVCSNNSAHTEIVTATITSSITTNPTCTGTGIRTYTATVTFDGRTYTDTKTEIIGTATHTWGDWIVLRDPSKDVDGIIERQCSMCSEKESRTIPFVQHVYSTIGSDIDESLIFRNRDDLSGHQISNGIDDIYDDAFFENYILVVVKTVTGNTNYVRTIDSYRASGDTIIITLNDTTPCGTMGACVMEYHSFYIAINKSETKNCDKIELEFIETKIHSYTPNVTAPTCTEQGYTTYTCFCGYSYVGDYVDATGHTYGTPTWTWSGYTSASAKFVCKNDNSHTQTVSATITNKVTTVATCTTVGVRKYTATVIFNSNTYTNTKNETISSLGHNYVNGVCTRCGTVKSSNGLSYTLLNDNTYSVTGIGTCEDTIIYIPSTYNGKIVTQIGADAFRFCRNLTSITIPNSVTKICRRAFSYCEKLKSITIPSSVTYIGEMTFDWCDSLTSVIFEDTSTWYSKDATYTYRPETKIDVTNPSTNATFLTDIYSNGDYLYKE